MAVREVRSAEELVGARGEFLGSLSHELRGALGLIRGYADTLLVPDAPRDEETVRRCLEAILETSSEMNELLEQMGDLSRVTAGALRVEPRPVQLRPLVRSAIGRACSQTARHRLRVDVPSRLPPVLADVRRLAQVLRNLIDNAIKYSPDGGQITISAAAVGGEVVVRVSDAGLGVSTDELNKLFERFYRTPAAQIRQIHGDGLGLAICKGIVEAHGGSIWAESPAPGHAPGVGPGTAIHFTLPIATTRPRKRRVLRSLVIALMLTAAQIVAVADAADGDQQGLETQWVEWTITSDWKRHGTTGRAL